jgi:glycosyltransferase involved in cell wall biosynthesis
VTSPLQRPREPAPEQTDAAAARPRLSAILIVRDEARRLPDCLASLHGLADELVVVDSGSTDDTVAIALAAGARVTSLPFTGFGQLKQAALDRASGDWILSVDADERVTPQLAADIRRVIGADAAAPAGFWIRRELVYLGRRLRFGGAESDWVLRLARRDRAHFTLRAVHEHLEVDGTTARLRGTLTHVKYDTLAEHVATIDRYTTLIADERALRGARFSSWHLLRVPWELFARLVLRLGFLDGRAGVIHATMSAFYAFLKYAKLWRHERALRARSSVGAGGDDRRGGAGDGGSER